MGNQNVNKEPRKCLKCEAEYIPDSNRQKYCTECSRRDTSICVRCGKEFPRGNTTGKYCSLECWYSSVREKRETRECPVCKKQFWSRSPKQKTCSRECGTALTRRGSKTCVVCGKEFSSKRSTQITCSSECSGIRRRLPRITNCERCGKEIEFNKYRHQRFCSEECRRVPVGEKRLDSNGYVLVKVGKDYRGADHRGWILEHRYIAEQNFGALLDTDTIHHINGDRTDNRIENLEVRHGRHGKGVRLSDTLVGKILSEPEAEDLSPEMRQKFEGIIRRALNSSD